MNRILLGTLIKGSEAPEKAIQHLAQYGFESFSPMFWESIHSLDMQHFAESIDQAAELTNTHISALSLYGNPLQQNSKGEEIRKSLNDLIEIAPVCHAPIVSCFAGRIPGTSVLDSLEAWRECFLPIIEKAEKNGIKIAFENCRMGDTWKMGKWNIAINPDAWELMLSQIPGNNWGLEWEPCHQVEALADPLPQLKTWLDHIIHIHGKDSRINKQLIQKQGLYGPERWHASCFPGFGDTSWEQLFDLLLSGTYTGTVDIEGWNDAQWSGEQEIPGQVAALTYLRACRLQAGSKYVR